MNLEERIRVARGELRADLLLRNARVVNVFAGDIHEANIAIFDGRIVGFGDYEAEETIDLEHKFLCPGFIDGHVHIESAMVTPAEFARIVVPLGTTSVVADPHEIANVLGLDGIRYMLEASRNLPLTVYIMLPSCVPATEMETSGAELTSEDLALFLQQEQVLGIAEMMNFPGVVRCVPDILEKIKIAKWKRVDGHAPFLSGKDLCAYAAAGIKSDHESSQLEEARDKLRAGMYVMIREGTTAKNLATLLPLIDGNNSRRCFFVTDDRHPADLIEDGHINSLVKKAIKLGLDPIMAIQMATINTAEYFQIKDLGAVSPGYLADILVLEKLEDVSICRVYKRGKLVAMDRKILPAAATSPRKTAVRGTVNVNWMAMKDFSVPAEGRRIKVIQLVPDQILTTQTVVDAKIVNGNVVSDIERDILKIAVVERHRASGNVGVGFVTGFGLKEGALASSVAHDSHNIVVVGTNDSDMLTAVIEIAKMQGGQVIVAHDKVIDALPLPIAGLMSDRPLEEVREKIESLNKKAQELGSTLKDPFMTISFLALPVIPDLKITDLGLVDVNAFKFTSLFES
jgi:adenine deaminase